MHVDAVHPAWLRHRPPGSRAARDVLARTTTRVALREVSKTDLLPVGSFTASKASYEHHDPARPAQPQPVVDHAGARYVEMHAPRTGGGNRPVEAQELVDYLRDDLPLSKSMARLPLDATFTGTPVRELWGVASLGGKVEGDRGEEIAPDRAGGVERDGRRDAATAIQAFLDAEVLVSDGKVYQRFRPYARAFEVRFGAGRAEVAVALDTGCNPAGPMPFVPSRAVEAVAFGRWSEASAFKPGAEDVLDLLPEGHDDGHDVRLAARTFLGLAARWLQSAERGERKAGRDGAETRRLAAGLLPWHMAARIGALAPEEYPDALQALSRAVEHMSATAPPGPPADRADLAHVRRYLAEVARPRLLDARPVPSEDADAVVTLAP